MQSKLFRSKKPASKHTSDAKTAGRIEADFYLTEYNSLRAEQMKRIESQTQVFYYLFLAIAFIVAGIGAGFTKPEYAAQIIFWTLLFLPLIISPLSALFFDHDMAIHAIGTYIHWTWRRNTVNKLIGNLSIYDDSLSFRFLKKDAKKIYITLSKTRGRVFLVLTVAPSVLSVIHFTFFNKWWTAVKGCQDNYQNVFGLLLISAMWLLDGYVSVVAIKAFRETSSLHKIHYDLIIVYKSDITDDDIYNLFTSKAWVLNSIGVAYLNRDINVENKIQKATGVKFLSYLEDSEIKAIADTIRENKDTGYVFHPSPVARVIENVSYEEIERFLY